MFNIWRCCRTKSLWSWLNSKKLSEKLAYRPRGHLRISGTGKFPGTVVDSARIQTRYFQSQGFWRWCSKSCSQAYLCEGDLPTSLDSLLYPVVWQSKKRRFTKHCYLQPPRKKRIFAKKTSPGHEIRCQSANLRVTVHNSWLQNANHTCYSPVKSYI